MSWVVGAISLLAALSFFGATRCRRCDRCRERSEVLHFRKWAMARGGRQRLCPECWREVRIPPDKEMEPPTFKTVVHDPDGETTDAVFAESPAPPRPGVQHPDVKDDDPEPPRLEGQYMEA